MRFLLIILFLTGCGQQQQVYRSAEASAYGPGQKITCTVVYAVAGDTIAAGCGTDLEKIKLIGIDAPEPHKSRKAARDAKNSGRTLSEELVRGKRASNYLQGILHENDAITVVLDRKPRDEDRSLLGYVYFKGDMLNSKILEAGFAVPEKTPPNIRFAPLFQSLYEEARQQERGLWAK